MGLVDPTSGLVQPVLQAIEVPQVPQVLPPLPPLPQPEVSQLVQPVDLPIRLRTRPPLNA